LGLGFGLESDLHEREQYGGGRALERLEQVRVRVRVKS